MPVRQTPTFLPGFLTATKPIVALCPPKVHTAGSGAGARPGPRDPETRRSRPQAELNSTDRLCGSTRLPLSGFTYS